MAEGRGLPVLHVQSAADLDPDWLAPFDVVGLTAGTSTPDATIDAVERALCDLAAPAQAGCAD
jgi:4-hydroxy-3-methylbut-2-enyl diphosphate reductase